MLVHEHREDAVTLMLDEGVTLSSLKLKATSISLRHSTADQVRSSRWEECRRGLELPWTRSAGAPFEGASYANR